MKLTANVLRAAGRIAFAPLLGLIMIQTLATPPAAAQSREQRQMMADIRMLQEQTQELSVAVATMAQALQDSIKAVNTRLDTANDTTRKGFADQKVIVDDRGKDIRSIRERVDDTNVRVSNVREELEAMRSSIQAPPPQATAPASQGQSARGIGVGEFTGRNASHSARPMPLPA